ncbi:MAG TPA: shikimate dehydrogenase [Candidatus Gallacutalibacter stercoravium]|nr:shikimate dehydrogenase [Candidatus Gallacutalibacter stercoravium]
MLKKQYAVIGHPIGHTLSPFINRRLFELAKQPADYQALDIAPGELKSALPQLRALDGYNITIPHKQAIIPFLDKLDRRAALCGSVNTVKNGEVSVGYSTDAQGFVRALSHAGIPLWGRVVIIGAGGAARAIAFEAARAGCSVTLAVRPSSLSRAAKLAGDILANVLHAQLDTCLLDRLDGFMDLLVNATPAGMYPDIESCPVDDSVLSNCSAVFDAVYNPQDTLLLRKARALGCRTVDGMPMLVWQAAASHLHWDGSTYQEADIDQLCEDSAKELRRIFG